ncbi:hypothetical protein HY250_03095 [Candidatus Azambacteria bacterium]|nr:hypothetical protein [Candidatus Azambacteria bacterium]
MKHTTQNKIKYYFNENGITIYLAMLVMSAALATALFVATIHTREFTISKDVIDSLRAVYAADTAVEYTLYKNRLSLPDLIWLKHTNDLGLTGSLSGNGYYTLVEAGCTSAIALPLAVNSACSIGVVTDLDPARNDPGCPSASAAVSCTKITGRGSYGNINRAIEIVYENL